MLLKTVEFAVQESSEEIVTNVSDITAGKKRNNKKTSIPRYSHHSSLTGGIRGVN